MAHAIILIATLSNSDALAQQEDRPNLVGVELLGRGGLYSFNYERYPTKRVGLGIGLALLEFDGTRIIVPLYASLNPIGDRHSLYLAAGTTLAGGWGKSSQIFGGSSDSGFFAFGTVSGGYEYRSFSGFVVRPTVNVLLTTEGNIVWPGITLGYRF